MERVKTYVRLADQAGRSIEEIVDRLSRRNNLEVLEALLTRFSLADALWALMPKRKLGADQVRYLIGRSGLNLLGESGTWEEVFIAAGGGTDGLAFTAKVYDVEDADVIQVTWHARVMRAKEYLGEELYKAFLQRNPGYVESQRPVPYVKLCGFPDWG